MTIVCAVLGDEAYTHLTGITGTIAWRTATEVGIDGGGFTWTGSVEAFAREWTGPDLSTAHPLAKESYAALRPLTC